MIMMTDNLWMRGNWFHDSLQTWLAQFHPERAQPIPQSNRWGTIGQNAALGKIQANVTPTAWWSSLFASNLVSREGTSSVGSFRASMVWASLSSSSTPPSHHQWWYHTFGSELQSFYSRTMIFPLKFIWKLTKSHFWIRSVFLRLSATLAGGWLIFFGRCGCWGIHHD